MESASRWTAVRASSSELHTPTPPQYEEESGALSALLVSVLGLIVCGGMICPVGWYLGNKELAAIDQGLRDPTKKDMAKAAKIIGNFGTAFVIAFWLFFILVGGLNRLGDLVPALRDAF